MTDIERTATQPATTPEGRRARRAQRRAQEKIWVIGGEDLRPGQIALYERDREHPRSGVESPSDNYGEVTVTKGGPAVYVAQTPLVFQKIGRGELLRVNADEADEFNTTWKEQSDTRKSEARARDLRDPRLASQLHQQRASVDDLNEIRTALATQAAKQADLEKKLAESDDARTKLDEQLKASREETATLRTDLENTKKPEPKKTT